MRAAWRIRAADSDTSPLRDKGGRIVYPGWAITNLSGGPAVENYTTGKEGMVEMWAKDLRLAQDLAAVNHIPAPIVDFIVANVLPEVGENGLTG